MRWVAKESLEQKRKRLNMKWIEWYTWYPVRVGDKRIWLESIMIKTNCYCGWDSTNWDYMTIDDWKKEFGTATQQADEILKEE